MKLENAWQHLFHCLSEVQYVWEPLCPDRLVQARREPRSYSPLVQYFGLGLDVDDDDLIAEGLTPEILQSIRSIRPAVSRYGSFFVPHGHWATQSQPKSDYVYLGQETFHFLRFLETYLECFVGKDVLDLGSGAGAISFEIAPLCKKVLGIDASASSVAWAQAAANVQGLNNVKFESAYIGTSEAEKCLDQSHWDIAVFNPPLAVPCVGLKQGHRDGGKLGLEIPLKFLDFAEKHLRTSGDVFCLMTNPIVRGRSELFDALSRRPWTVVGKKCLNDNFNGTIARKEGYQDLGIQKIELWFLHLKRKKS